MLYGSYVLNSLCLALLCFVSVTLSQGISGTDANATTSVPIVCFNGELVGGMCMCSPGWSGILCDICTNARIK